MPQKYKVLITGSSGMLGQDLCQELSGEYEVIGIDFVQRTAYSVQRFIKGDITDKKILGIVEKIKPDIVIHAAAYTDVDGCEFNKEKCYKINSEGARDIALACKKTNSFLIYISTDFVFNGRKKTSYNEKDRPNPLSVYGESKLSGENFIKKILKK